MKRVKLLLLLLTLSALLLAACGKDDTPTEDNGGPITPEVINPVESGENPSEETPAAEPSTEPAGGEDSEPVSTDDSVPPQEGMVRSLLTNEWVDADVASTRPIAVMTPNENAALPLYNISQASILYEAPVEGGMSRTLAVYEGWENLEKIGNVRSLRTYFAYLALEWDAFIVHVGGPYYVNDLLARNDVQDLDEDHTAFFRDDNRKAPHNCYINGAGVKKVIESRNWSLSYRGLTDDHHFLFASKAEPNTLDQYASAQSVKKIDMSSCYSMHPYLEYNEEDGLYYRYYGSGKAYTDAVNGEQLAFKNVLVQRTHTEDLGDGYLVMGMHDGSEKGCKKEGWYFTNGKMIKVTWSKPSDFSATRYYDENGNEITLNTGKTMIMLIKDNDTFSYE